MSKERKELEAELADCKNGPGRRLYSALKLRLGIQMQAMHGGSMNGNGVRQFYKQRVAIMAGLRQMQLFSVQGKPRPLFGAEDNAWLDNVGDQRARQCISPAVQARSGHTPEEVLRLWQLLLDAFKKTVTNKGHGTAQLVWRYNEYWASRGQSSGLHVEQFAEAIHQLVKRLKRAFASTPKKARTEAMFQALQVITRVQRLRAKELAATKAKESQQ